MKHSPDAYDNINLLAYEKSCITTGAKIVPVIKMRYQSMGFLRIGPESEYYYHGNMSVEQADKTARAFMDYHEGRRPVIFIIDRKKKKMLSSYGVTVPRFLEKEIVKEISKGCDSPF